MCLNVCVAGISEAKGTHLSVFLFLMKGPHDDELTWPLRGKCEVKLLYYCFTVTNTEGLQQHVLQLVETNQ